MVEPARSFPMAALVAATHLLAGSVGVPVATAVAWYNTVDAIQLFVPAFDHGHASRLLLTLPGYPLQCLGGFFLGFSLAKRFGAWISQFAWVVPVAIATLVWLDAPGGSGLLEHFRFDGTCRPDAPCLGKALATLLVVSSVSYSFGAAVGMRARISSGAGNGPGKQGNMRAVP